VNESEFVCVCVCEITCGGGGEWGCEKQDKLGGSAALLSTCLHKLARSSQSPPRKVNAAKNNGCYLAGCGHLSPSATA
jgi:hypothetical protein